MWFDIWRQSRLGYIIIDNFNQFLMETIPNSINRLIQDQILPINIIKRGMNGWALAFLKLYFV